MTLHHFTPDTPVEQISDHLRRWGYAIVDDVVDQATIEIVNRTPDPVLGTVPPGKNANKTTRKTDVAKTSFWKSEFTTPPVLAPAPVPLGP